MLAWQSVSSNRIFDLGACDSTFVLLLAFLSVTFTLCRLFCVPFSAVVQWFFSVSPFCCNFDSYFAVCLVFLLQSISISLWVLFDTQKFHIGTHRADFAAWFEVNCKNGFQFHSLNKLAVFPFNLVDMFVNSQSSVFFFWYWFTHAHTHTQV